MQGLVDPPREDLDPDAVRALLNASTLTVRSGLELLDASNMLVEDISDDLESGSITRDNFVNVHASCRLVIRRGLAWGRDRVRPYMVLSDGTTEARFDLGVYIMTTPDSHKGETPQSWDVAGFDLLTIMQAPIVDVVEISAGTTYFAAVQTAVTNSGVGADLWLDGSLQATALPEDRVWCPTDDGTSWLRVANDLLAEIGYLGLWMQPDGSLFSRPWVDPAVRAPEWTLDSSDASTDLMDPDRTLTEDVWNKPNRWVFVQRDRSSAPSEGDGLYTVDNVSNGASSQDSVGRVVPKRVSLDAADQAALEAQGDRIVAEDTATATVATLKIDPLPLMWHRDMFLLKDGGRSDKLEAASWTLNLDGSKGALVLGGGVSSKPDPVSVETTGTVTNPSGPTVPGSLLRVQPDGAATDCRATFTADRYSTNAARWFLGDRVRLTIRNPLMPLVTGLVDPPTDGT